MRIIGPPSAPVTDVRDRLVSWAGNPRFLGEMFQPLWDAALRYYIDPVGLVVQSYKETGGGNFGRAVTPDHFNTGGLKIYNPAGLADDDPNAHQRFPKGWRVGALAHAQHVLAYAGGRVDETTDLVLSPRYVHVFGKHRLENWSEFGGGTPARWAPSPAYGQEIEQLMRRLQGVTP